MGGKAGPGFSIKGLLLRITEKSVTKFHILLRMALPDSSSSQEAFPKYHRLRLHNYDGWDVLLGSRRTINIYAASPVS